MVYTQISQKGTHIIFQIKGDSSFSIHGQLHLYCDNENVQKMYVHISLYL